MKQLKGPFTWKYGLIGIKLYDRYSESKRWKEDKFIFKLYSSTFFASFGGVTIVLCILTQQTFTTFALLIILVLIFGLIYGLSAQKHFQKYF